LGNVSIDGESNHRLNSRIFAIWCIFGPEIIQTSQSMITISHRKISFTRDGKRDISFRIITRISSVHVLQDFIVRPLISIHIDVSYQKSTGSITGWYYHKNSELYVLPCFTNPETKN
jgi:hypothetical protein